MPLAFVDSVAEIFGSLCAGVPLWFPLNTKGDAVNALMSPLLSSSTIIPTHVTMLPSQLYHVLTTLERRRSRSSSSVNNKLLPTLFDGLRLVVVSGKPCNLRLVERFCCCRSSSSPLLVNLYGQTETAGDVLCAVLLHDPAARFLQAKKWFC